MLYHLAAYLFDNISELSFLRLFQYLSFRTIAAALTAFAVTLIFGEYVIRYLYVKRIRDIPREYSTISTASKDGTPQMGGLLIILAISLSTILWCDLLNRFTVMFF
ncbi:MAG: phospho-N-acetylmuramoyl-pentapeptide-transferase, partial [Gemmatimonadota bacterium]|nr:phospho-N-acetylmuramoyl-pentapeptide-transferase [Gemmatimonadota bacterium]